MLKDELLSLIHETEDKGFVVLEERAKSRVHRFQERMLWFMTEFMEWRPSKRRYYIEQLQEAGETTSDFPLMFGTVLQRELLAKYKIQTADWQQYVKRGTQRDFRPTDLLTLYGLQSALQKVPQQGQYPNDNLFEGTKVENVLGKFGRQFNLAWENIINDDLGAFSDAAQRLAQAAEVTEAYQATLLFAAAGGPSTALFDASSIATLDGKTIANKGTTVLSSDALDTIFGLMTSQKDADNNPILIRTFHLVVPPKKYTAALRAVAPDALIATGVGNSAATSTSKNVIADLNIKVHMNPFLPIIDTTHGDTTYYVFADPQSDGAACQMNFLTGHEAPEITMKAPDKQTVGGGLVSAMEGDFGSDSMAWRVRHVLGGKPVDPRFAYAMAATT